MSDRPNDRIPTEAPDGDDPEPRVYLVVGGEKFGRPGLETFYAPAPGGSNSLASTSSCSCDAVAGTYCSCNKVCTCNLVCTCDGHKPPPGCSCVGYQSYGGGIGGCSCNKVCSCVPVH
jgi:hypothetical protein